MMTIIFLKP